MTTKLDTSKLCPSCGATRNSQRASVDLDENLLTLATGQVLRLTSTQAEIMSVLTRCAPRIAPHDLMIGAVWGAGEGDDARSSLKVHVCGLKKKLRPFGARIENVHSRGYRFVEVVS